jgi:hypothetical protein
MHGYLNVKKKSTNNYNNNKTKVVVTRIIRTRTI